MDRNRGTRPVEIEETSYYIQHLIVPGFAAV